MSEVFKYKIEYLSIAKKDIVEMTVYISNILNNPKAAEQHAIRTVEAIDNLSIFPYRNSLYFSVKELMYEHRKLSIKNYIVFYYVNEQTKTITIVRVLYQKRNLRSVLE